MSWTRSVFSLDIQLPDEDSRDDRSTWTMPRTSSATLCQRCSFAALVRLATHTVRAQLQLASVLRERLRSRG